MSDYQSTYVVEAVKFQQSMLIGAGSNATNAESNWVAGTYATGAKVLRSATPTTGWMKGISMLRVFESLVDSNTSTPGEDSEKWQDIGPANTVGMFTSRIGEVTARSGGLTAKLAVGSFVSCVAFFGLKGSELTLTVRTSGGVVRSTETRTLTERPGVVDWLTFFFAPIEQTTQAVFLPITCLPTDTLEVSITGEAECGRMVFGRLVELGSAPEYGASWAMDNYTSADPDEFGYVDPIVKDYAPRNQVSVYVDPSRSNNVLSTLISLRGTPTIFIGTTDANYVNAMVNFGLIRDPAYALSGPTHNILDFEFKGFV